MRIVSIHVRNIHFRVTRRTRGPGVVVPAPAAVTRSGPLTYSSFTMKDRKYPEEGSGRTRRVQLPMNQTTADTRTPGKRP